MSGVIAFQDRTDEVWQAAGWAFTGFLNHVRLELAQQDDLTHIIDQAMALNGLHFDLIGAQHTAALLPIMLRVADEILRGTRGVEVAGKVLDETSQRQFRATVRDLQGLLLRHARPAT